MLQLRAGSQMDARVMAVLNCLATDMEVFADETGKAPAPPDEQDAASKGLLPTAKHMLGLRCWALLHTPDLTDLEQDLGLLIADANSSELDAELHARILQRYTQVGAADKSKPGPACRSTTWCDAAAPPSSLVIRCSSQASLANGYVTGPVKSSEKVAVAPRAISMGCVMSGWHPHFRHVICCRSSGKWWQEHQLTLRGTGRSCDPTSRVLWWMEPSQILIETC